MKYIYLVVILVAVLCLACEENPKLQTETTQEHSHAEEGKHGGHILDADGLHVEFVHDMENGTLDIHILGADAKTEKAISGPVKLNLKTKGGPKQFEMKSVDEKDGQTSQFHLRGPIVKGKIEGRIAFSVGEKNYNVSFSHDHDDHKGHDHEGHDHDEDHEHDH